VAQLEHAGRIEDVDVERYNSRGVDGWTLHRAHGERCADTMRTHRELGEKETTLEWRKAK
jgi:hypothetical protein